MIKKIFVACAVALVVLVVIVSINALRLRPDTVAFDTVRPIELDRDALVDRFAGAIRFPTISHEDIEDTDSVAFRGLHDYFAEQYPGVRGTLTREVVGGLSLLYTWDGTEPDLDPVVLMGHLDVVPVIPGTEEDWAYDPFGGEVADGFIWGRGTMDDKISVVAVLEAVERLIQDGYRPRRTVYLAFGHDEEVGGSRGAAAIEGLLSQRGAEPYAFVLDEGGMIAEGLIPGVEGLVALVGIAEKGYVSVELVVEGPGGHSAMPPPETNIGILAAAIVKLQEAPFPASLDGATRDMFLSLAPHMPFLARAVLGNLWLFEPVVETVLASDPTVAAMLRTTTAPTIIEGGVKANVLPIRARAIVNHRIMPGESPESVIARVTEIVSDTRVSIGVSGEEARGPSPVSDPTGAAFRLVERTIHETTGGEPIIVAPWLVAGGTDAKYYSGSSENIFRFLPSRFEADALTRFHGTNERMEVGGYLASVRFFHRLIRNADDL
jgi:carboxypeptidase PM20D1